MISHYRIKDTFGFLEKLVFCRFCMHTNIIVAQNKKPTTTAEYHEWKNKNS